MQPSRTLLALCLAVLAACGSTPASDNRDPRGPADVQDYIERLESPQRLAELQQELVVERLALNPDAWVADIGCGPGVFTLPLARATPAGVTFAVDVEPRQLDRMRERMRDAGVTNFVPVLASADSPHLPGGRFDLLFIGDTYHHFEGRVEYMRALKRLLRPGGRLAILEYKPGPLEAGPPPDHKLAEGELERELEAAGWRLDARFDTHRYHDFQVWVPAP